MTKAVNLALGYFALALACVGAADTNVDIVTLTMTERAGVERKAEWITIGVPLPKGLVKSTEELCLRQNGRTVPCEVLAVNKWWDDGTLRWVHLIFQSDCPPNGKALVTLARASASQRPKESVTVMDKPGRFVVDTGAISFEVRKKGFNIIDVVKTQDQKIINSHSRGLYVLVEENKYSTALDEDVRVTLEETGPLHVVLRATGSFKNSKGVRRLDFDCRLYAYAGSPQVRVVVTVINRQGRDADCIPLSALILELPTAIHSGDCLFGSEDGGTKHGSLSDKPEAYIYQTSSTEHVFGGAVKGKGQGKQTKPDNIGWGHLWGENKGIGIGIRYFWQMHPKSIEFTKDGMARAGLYPARHDKPLKIYTGVARTHELLLCFGEGGADIAKLKSTFASLQQPLRPFAPPSWYCRHTKGLGDYCESGGVELYGPFAEKVARFDEAFETANRRSQSFRDSKTMKGVETDSYGFLGFGDGVHYVWTAGADVPENIAWTGNYYGYPHMMCIQFVRTGSLEYFDNFEAHALHVADVHVVHHSEKNHLIGGCRYCPPTDHVRIDPTDWKNYKTAKVYVSNLFNHHKIAGVIERWYFLRDHRSLDVATMVLDYCCRWKYGDNDYGQPRGPGMIMDFCYQGYMLTGDRKWIERASNVLRVHKGRDLKLSFQAGIFLEGMRRYYEMSGDEEALAYTEDSVDRLIDTGKKGGVTAQAHSFMYLKTRERKYLDAALDNLPQSGRFGNPWKDFALSMRNAAMCIGDFYHAAKMDIMSEGCRHKIISYDENRSSLGSTRQTELSSRDGNHVGTIRNGTVWRDTSSNEIWCNGGHMIRQGDTFYWVGYETKPRTGFRSIKLYSSTNLTDWKFENNILRREGPLSILGWAGRPGLLHNLSTKKYVLIIEADSQQWERHKVGFAQSDTIGGDYRFVRYVYPEPNRSTGDQSVYQEGKDGYLVCTLDKLIDGKRYLNQSLAIFKLTPDFLNVQKKVYEGFDNVNGDPSVYPRHHTGREASHIIKVNGVYYWFSLGLEGWNSTQTKYATSTSLSGPWSTLTVLTTEPVSKDSFNTQHDFVIPVMGSETTTYLYVGDRYSQHHGKGVGRNIFLPLIWQDGKPALKWYRTWRIDTATGCHCEEDHAQLLKRKPEQ